MVLQYNSPPKNRTIFIFFSHPVRRPVICTLLVTKLNNYFWHCNVVAMSTPYPATLNFTQYSVFVLFLFNHWHKFYLHLKCWNKYCICCACKLCKLCIGQSKWLAFIVFLTDHAIFSARECFKWMLLWTVFVFILTRSASAGKFTILHWTPLTGNILEKASQTAGLVCG